MGELGQWRHIAHRDAAQTHRLHPQRYQFRNGGFQRRVVGAVGEGREDNAVDRLDRDNLLVERGASWGGHPAAQGQRQPKQSAHPPIHG